jgi:AraC family transcriptional regulator, transcriptional activator of pobA
LDSSTGGDVLRALEPVPTFYLYGEAHRSAGEHFVHAESLDDRSRPAGWRIRPHSHRELNHLILITAGGGVMQTEGTIASFEAPCLLLVPSQVVHGFRWHSESRGSVITIASTYRDELVRRDPDAAPLFAALRVASLTKDVAQSIETQARVLIRELGWIAPGHLTAVDAALALIVVEALRGLKLHSRREEQGRGRHAELVARFRGLVEERYRLREPIGEYARRLGVSPTTLRVACSHVAGAPPAEIVNLRALLEAKRSLCYTNQSVAQIAYSLGFIDPAYFTRSFTKHAGQSPRQFRIDHEIGSRAAS